MQGEEDEPPRASLNLMASVKPECPSEREAVAQARYQAQFRGKKRKRMDEMKRIKVHRKPHDQMKLLTRLQ